MHALHKNCLLCCQVPCIKLVFFFLVKFSEPGNSLVFDRASDLIFILCRQCSRPFRVGKDMQITDG